MEIFFVLASLFLGGWPTGWKEKKVFSSPSALRSVARQSSRFSAPRTASRVFHVKNWASNNKPSIFLFNLYCFAFFVEPSSRTLFCFTFGIILIAQNKKKEGEREKRRRQLLGIYILNFLSLCFSSNFSAFFLMNSRRRGSTTKPGLDGGGIDDPKLFARCNRGRIALTSLQHCSPSSVLSWW